MSAPVNCRHCGHEQSEADGEPGQLHTCESCGKLFTAPSRAGATAVVDADASGPAHSASPTERPDPSERVDTAEGVAQVAWGAGEVLGASWTIYKRQMGVITGAVLGAAFVGNLGSLPAQFFQRLAEMQGGDDGLGLMLIAMLLRIPAAIFSMYMNVGTAIVVLKAARGEPVQIGDIFTGGRYLVRACGAGMVFGIALVVGLIMCVIPGIVVALMFAPWMFVLIDEDPAGLDSLWRTRALTKGHWGALLLLGLGIAAINVGGLLACCIGLFVSIPLGHLAMAVAYCRMAGHPTAETLVQEA